MTRRSLLWNAGMMIGVLIACSDDRSEAVSTERDLFDAPRERGADTVLEENVWSDIDTLPVITELSLYNRPYELSIEAEPTGKIPNDHKMHLRLTSQGAVVWDTILVRESFTGLIDAAALDHSALFRVEFDFYRARSLYFKAYIKDGRSGVTHIPGFRVWYLGKGKGDLFKWLYEDSSAMPRAYEGV